MFKKLKGYEAVIVIFLYRTLVYDKENLLSGAPVTIWQRKTFVGGP